MIQRYSSQTEIINAALSRIGSTSSLISIDDNGNTAARIRNIWGGLLRLLLVQHPWNFAIRRALLNAHGGAPAFGWNRQYQLPADCLRWLPPAEGDQDWFAGECEGGFILTNAEAPLPCRYIGLACEVSKWSPGFAYAMEGYLAEALAEPVTQSESISARMEQRAEYWARQAKRIDGLETGRARRGNVTARSTWLAGRNRTRPQVGR